MEIESIRKRLLWFGIFSMLSALVWISTAIAINPSFDFYTGALSQLGSPGAYMPWVYNVGLMFTSILLFIFAISLLLYSKNRIESSGSSFLMISALFLALIGIYHGGTYPHDFVSLWFFVLADISILTWGLGLFMESIRWGIYTVMIAIIASSLGFILKWPSSAELETFGTAAISLWAILTTFYLRIKYRNTRI
ncbi:MAG: DUF998 domain-containing protein [Candidatus Thermoplasmatota archaeon]|nr:DUF998 domain-containing protein [Candidatus Thermoplasmatota archaeon]